jgi:hypothetical protein
LSPKARTARVRRALLTARKKTRRAVLARAKHDPAYQAFLTLRVGFTVPPIGVGIDKFCNNLVNREQSLAHAARLRPAARRAHPRAAGVAI